MNLQVLIMAVVLKTDISRKIPNYFKFIKKMNILTWKPVIVMSNFQAKAITPERSCDFVIYFHHLIYSSTRNS